VGDVYGDFQTACAPTRHRFWVLQLVGVARAARPRPIPLRSTEPLVSGSAHAGDSH